MRGMSVLKRVQWAGKLLKASDFAVLIDDEACLNFRSQEPFLIEDLDTLVRQAEALEIFMHELDLFSRQHDKYVDEYIDKFLVKQAKGKNVRKPKAKTTKTTKVKR